MSNASEVGTKSAKKVNVRVNYLNSARGDKETKFEDDPSSRAKLAKKIAKLIRQGTACFLQIGKGSNAVNHKITGYDAETNEWQIQGSPSKLSAEGTEVIVMPPTSGG